MAGPPSTGIMPLTASRRLDMVALPQDPDHLVDIGEFQLWLELQAAALRCRGDRPGPAAGELVEGGFARLWFDRPGRRTFYANERGGVRAACPACHAPMAGELSRWLRQSRILELPEPLQCPRCAAACGPTELCYSPPAAWARVAVIFADIGGAGPGPALDLSPLFGAWRWILRRPL
jgi:hypothetical protein